MNEWSRRQTWEDHAMKQESSVTVSCGARFDFPKLNKVPRHAYVGVLQ
jgi:hypothetical protein